ncbi:hypothetical protein [Kineococcus sp. SYSU DK004]|uniref:hypothetical protein n=1 Tax=Kineococcus sp. SYSU DK004 TaxID=3383125 RepID=UPI003D7D83AF
MSEPTTGTPDPAAAPDADPDADPGELNPRDLRGEETGDGADTSRDGDEAPDSDADPGQLNPRDDT